MQSHILSIILFTPLVGAFLLLFVPKENKDAIRWIANIFALAGFLVSLPLVPWFWAQIQSPDRFKFLEGAANNWIPSIGAGYVLGIDGISFLLIMLTTLLGWVSILSSWTAIENRVKEYYVWFLVLQTGMMGVFMSLDFFLFFVFWEAMLVPMYLLIGIWGGPNKLYAAIKFFLYTLFGSVLMLLGILFLYFHHHTVTGIYTFSIPELYKTAPQIPFHYGHPAATAVGGLGRLHLAATRRRRWWRRHHDVRRLLRNEQGIHGLGCDFDHPRSRHVRPQRIVERAHELLRFARSLEVGDGDDRLPASGDFADIDRLLGAQRQQKRGQDDRHPNHPVHINASIQNVIRVPPGSARTAAVRRETGPHPEWHVERKGPATGFRWIATPSPNRAPANRCAAA